MTPIWSPVGLRSGPAEVVREQGLFCSLYTDRGSHFCHTSVAGAGPDAVQEGQVSRALRVLGIRHILARSPEARGRSERAFGTIQGRLPQELRLAGITTVEAANRFLRERYIAEFNRQFTVPAAQPGNAFVPVDRRRLPYVFSIQNERVVNRDNTVSMDNRILQIDKVTWRATLAGCRVIVYQHLDGTLTVGHGPHVVGRYTAEGIPLREKSAGRAKAVEKWKSKTDSHFPTAMMMSKYSQLTMNTNT